MKRFTAFLIAATFAFVLFANVPLARAQAKSPETSDKKSEEEPDMLGWKWANFAVLAAGLAWLGVKKGSPYFSAQMQTIRQGLEEARRNRAASDARAAEVQQKLANIGAEIEQFRSTVIAEQNAEVERLGQRMRNEMEASWANAAQQIESTGKNARLDLRRYASSLALELAEQRIRGRMNPAVQASLTNDFVRKLKA